METTLDALASRQAKAVQSSHTPRQARLRAAAIHLAASLLVAALCALLVFQFWYPMPYRELSGGRELFLLVVAVDVVMGPLITLAIFDTRKAWPSLRRDVMVVALLQLAALGYGLYTVAIARPAVVALEGDRIRVVRPIDLTAEELAKGPAALQSLPWFGIAHVATRPARPDEQFEAINMGLAGVDIGARPQFWLPPEAAPAAWAAHARPIARLRNLHPSRGADVDAAIAATGLPESSLKYLPIIARRTDYVALVHASEGRVVGYAQLDGH